MSMLKRPAAAVGILALCVLFGVIFGSFRSVSALKKDAEEIFYSGIEGDGIGVAGDLTARQNAVVNLCTIARKYLDAGDPLLKNAEAATAALAGADTVGEQAAANESLEQAAFALGRALEDLGLPEQDENYRRGLLAELASRSATMSHDGYNDAAREYNEALNALPAGPIARLLGLAPLEDFR